MKRDEWEQLQQGVRLRDWEHREWTVRAAPYWAGRDLKVVLVSGALVRHEAHWHADSYTLIEEPAADLAG